MSAPPGNLAEATEPASLLLHLEPALRLDDDQLFELCAANGDLRIERTDRGDLIVMSPAGGESSLRNAEVTMQLNQWAKRDGRGRAFDSSAGFRLANGAMRSPDAAWVESERLQRLTADQRQKFLPLCPTFVIEIRSPSDRLSSVRGKMREYAVNGARLGWLIDPVKRRVQVFRPTKGVETLDAPASLSGSPELPGFELDLTEIWDPVW
jgi:Uma2 family endonuclease